MKLNPILQLKPILRTRGDVIVSDSFERTMKLEWQPLMKTRVLIADGRLKPLSLFSPRTFAIFCKRTRDFERSWEKRRNRLASVRSFPRFLALAIPSIFP